MLRWRDRGEERKGQAKGRTWRSSRVPGTASECRSDCFLYNFVSCSSNLLLLQKVYISAELKRTPKCITVHMQAP